MVRKYVLFFLHYKFKVNMLLKNRKEYISTCTVFFALHFVAKLHFSTFLVEIMKYLGGLFQLLSTSERERGNLKKNTAIISWRFFSREVDSLDFALVS